MSQKRKVITIDGLASTGKSSAASALVAKFRESGVKNIVHFSSGILYRTLGYLSLKEGLNPEDEDGLLTSLSSHLVELKPNPKAFGVSCFLDGRCFDLELRSAEVSERTSQISALPKVREQLLQLQREAVPECHLVAEGRDMGTVVFPESELKFFLQVDPEVKAERRLLQWQEDEKLSDLDALARKGELKREITQRDERDAERLVAPTVPAKDAVILDNSRLELTELVEKMYNCAFKRSVFSRS